MANSSKSGFRVRRSDGTPKIDVTISVSALCLVGGCSLVALAWLFWMGFMVGRGQNPETQLENIAGIIQGTKQSAMDSRQKMLPETKEGAEQATAEAEGQEGQEADAASAPQPAATPDSGAETAAGTQPANQGAQPPAAQPDAQAKKEAEPAEAEPVVVYRLATLPSLQAAQKEQKRLDAKGIKSQIVKSGKIFLLRHTVRGTKENAEYRQKIRAAGIKAVSTPQKKKR